MENSYEKAKTQSAANSLNEKPIQNKAIALQDNRPASILQRKANNTGLPNNLKSGIENLSGHSMDDVKVHYNSNKPAQLNAHAYAQGTDIHIASGQEKHLPHEAWHIVQQKQGRVKPTLQMKGRVNVNDDKGLESEADIMGAKALQMKSESGSVNSGNKKNNSTSNIVQRKVFINGVEKVLDPSGLDIFNYPHIDWIIDDYIRNYLSEDEFDAHDNGRPVKCGLLENMGLWYRLPFPSAVAGGPATTFFLIGENHGYTPISTLLKASNQQGAKALVESSAAFRNTQMGVGAGAGANLGTLADNGHRHHIELGLAKALHAFASMRGPTDSKKKTAQPDNIVPYAIAGGANVVGKHKMLSKTDQDAVTFSSWKIEAAGQPKYRDINGILYFLRVTPTGPKGVRRPKAPGANNYNQGGAMEAFLRRPEIVNALPLPAKDAYTRVVESLPAERAGSAYERRYTRAYDALRQASLNNINTVYPGKTIVGRSPQANVSPAEATEDGEVGMRHRNTVMLAGLRQAIAEGGYTVASLGAQHVLDIAAWENTNHGLHIPIITYNNFVKNFSTEAE